MNFKSISILFCVLATTLIYTSCTKNNKEDILAGLDPCDTTVTNYQDVVKPILDQFCSTSGCHNATSVAGGYNLEDHASLQTAALGSRFMGSLNHESGFSPMPKGGGKLTDCQIRKIERWVNNGALNN